MTSDSTGEIYVITKEDGSGVADVSQVANDGHSSTPTSSGGSSSPSPSAKSGSANRCSVGSSMYWVVCALVASAMI